jgi:hypothetical protein
VGVDLGVVDVAVAEESHGMENVFGFVVFHGDFEVSKRMEGNLVDAWVTEFPGDPFRAR